MSDITPSRGYLIRGLHEWLLDNDLTPHIAVDAAVPDTQVPYEFVKDGQITLNIATGAVRNLLIDNEGISFSARFAGTPRNIFVPVASVLAIFARETGVGMGFGMEPGADALNKILEQAHADEPAEESHQQGDSISDKATSKKTRPGLRVVK